MEATNFNRILFLLCTTLMIVYAEEIIQPTYIEEATVEEPQESSGPSIFRTMVAEASPFYGNRCFNDNDCPSGYECVYGTCLMIPGGYSGK